MTAKKSISPIVKIEVTVRKNDNQAFIIPNGTTAALEKRRETVRGWVGRQNYDNNTNIYDNVPTKGFKVESFTSRYSTSNKFIKVSDPRGWIVDVSIENFVDLLSTTTVENGVFKDEIVYCDGGSWLAVANDKRLLATSKKPSAKMNFHDVGDIVDENDSGNKMVYLGKRGIVTAQVDYGSKKIQLVRHEDMHFYMSADYKAYSRNFTFRKQKLKGAVAGHRDVNFTEIDKLLNSGEGSVGVSGVSYSYFTSPNKNNVEVEDHFANGELKYWIKDCSVYSRMTMEWKK